MIIASMQEVPRGRIQEAINWFLDNKIATDGDWKDKDVNSEVDYVSVDVSINVSGEKRINVVDFDYLHRTREEGTIASLHSLERCGDKSEDCEIFYFSQEVAPQLTFGIE